MPLLDLCVNIHSFECWPFLLKLTSTSFPNWTGPRSTVGNVSGYRGMSDCIFRGREFDPGPVPYFLGDRS